MFEKLTRLLARWHVKFETLARCIARGTFIGILISKNGKLTRFSDVGTQPRWHATTLARKPRWHAGTHGKFANLANSIFINLYEFC